MILFIVTLMTMNEPPKAVTNPKRQRWEARGEIIMAWLCCADVKRGALKLSEKEIRVFHVKHVKRNLILYLKEVVWSTSRDHRFSCARAGVKLKAKNRRRKEGLSVSCVKKIPQAMIL